MVAVTAFSLLAVACGGTSASDSAVRPFEEIQASDLVFEADPFDPARSIFRVETTEPAICAIVWGETEALGNFNNSLAMNGTGIIDHDVFLPGAEQGKTYYFQLQGSTADGTLYQSELETFTIPVTEGSADSSADEMAVHGANLAEAGTISDVSSEFSDTWAASNAIDGDFDSEWSTSGDGDDAFITIDLGSQETIAGVEFITRSMADGTAITTTYWVTIDGGERMGPFPAGTPADFRFQELSDTGRVIRFDAEDTTGGNTGAVEVRVFAPAP